VDNISEQTSIEQVAQHYKTFCATILSGTADRYESWPLMNKNWIRAMASLIQQGQDADTDLAVKPSKATEPLANIMLKIRCHQMKARIHHAAAETMAVAKSFCEDNEAMLSLLPNLRTTTFNRNNAANVGIRQVDLVGTTKRSHHGHHGHRLPRPLLSL